MTTLRLTEIFLSIQGEANAIGWPTVFIRLTGCPLRCVWCDTNYSFTGGEKIDLDDVVARVDAFGVRHVCVTGGEPLAQRACIPLLAALCDRGYAVSLETSGALDVSAVDPRVSKVVDIKCPGSGEVARNHLENIALLAPGDQLKFVIADRADYDWSVSMVRSRALAERCTVLFSPVTETLAAAQLADWIVADRLPVRFQMQLHKVLWGNQPGR